MKLVIQQGTNTTSRNIEEYEVDNLLQMIETEYEGERIEALPYEFARFRIPNGVAIIFYDNRKIRTRNYWFEVRGLAILAKHLGLQFFHTVPIRFSDGHEIQILPAIKTATGIRIASVKDDRWSKVIKPEKFAEKLVYINKKNNGGVVPIIKLYKAINAQLPTDVQLSGYHIESLSIEAFENYEGPKTRKSMLMHLTNFSSSAVLDPIKDSTGQSINVDDYLGDPNSIERIKASAAIKRIYARMIVADTGASIDKWKDLMGE